MNCRLFSRKITTRLFEIILAKRGVLLVGKNGIGEVAGVSSGLNRQAKDTLA